MDVFSEADFIQTNVTNIEDPMKNTDNFDNSEIWTVQKNFDLFRKILLISEKIIKLVEFTTA